MKGIIYVRVSSDEQVKGTSLDDQEERCRQYCKDHNIEVTDDNVYREEGASAKTADRAKLLEALEFCRKNKGKIGAFVVWKVDRFARNTEDHFGVRKILLDYGVSLHSVTEPIGDSPAEKLFEVMLAGFAEFDNAIRTQRCTNGMLARIKQGVWPWRPPVGYTCGHFSKKGLKKNEPDAIDETVFPIIQEVLRGYSRGIYTQCDIVARLKHERFEELTGMRPTLQLVDQLLGKQLLFYVGILKNPWPAAQDGTDTYFKGKHTPMITEEEMLQIQAIKSGKKLKLKHDRHNPIFPLRRILTCSDCKKTLTGSTSQGGSGKKHPYYHCYNRACALKWKGIEKKVVEDDFEELLGHIIPTDEFFAFFREVVRDVWTTKQQKLATHADQYHKELQEVEAQRKKIFLMRECDIYNDEQFKERMAEADNRAMAVKISLSETRIDKFSIESAISYAEQFISDLKRQWRDLPQTVRPRFQRLLLPQGITYHRETRFGTPILGCIFRLNQQFVADKSALVDPSGLEPLTSSMRMTRSTR